MDESRVRQPPWHAPSGTSKGLKIFNSLTRTKTEFIPMNENQVGWYSCGPTVYDSSHLGHARNYVTIDINRRIMADYFGYNILLVQNVTDIDDKIIIGARQKFLVEQFTKQFRDAAHPAKDLVAKASDAVVLYAKEKLPDGGPESLDQLDKWSEGLNIAELAIKDPKLPMNLKAVKTSVDAINTAETLTTDAFLSTVNTVLAYALDKEKGATVKDNAVFREFAAYWEAEFDKDMRALNVLPPSVTTRVSEYVPEIVTFVKKIIDNGYGYETVDGSVYFDTVAFEASGEHSYAKLQPWNKGQLDLIEEGEGSLGTKLQGKKSRNDFALWKASKAGEPSWDSPWGEGRPGWHIECSVMASEILGPQLDIHSGGIDLAFPHHDNELAQAEACHGNDQWVNYFLHTGHLHIEGQKMSKSLKNFITINEALSKYTPRQIRLTFALQQWNSQVDFKHSLSETKAYESTVTNLFNNVRALVRDQEDSRVVKKADPEELALYKALNDCQAQVHAAFSDNLSTPVALQAIGELIQKSNTYIAAKKANVKVEVLSEVARWITKTFGILGFEVNNGGIGWAREDASGGANAEDIALPYVQVLSKFRDNVRNKAIAKAPYSEFLIATDKLRDEELLDIGVSIDDRADGNAALIKFLDTNEKAELVRQREEKLRKEQERQAKKAEAMRLEAERLAERLAKARISPADMFKGNSEYSQFDDTGFPVADTEGKPLSKSLIKKLTKLRDAQAKLHDEYLARNP